MAVKKMWFLPCGWLTVDKSITTNMQGLGVPLDIPVISVLIDTDDGYVLYDTGLDPEGITNPIGTWKHKSKVVKSMLKENDIRFQLKKLSLTPLDIPIVVNSHLHWDHTGGNRFFKNSTIYVQKAEYRFAYYPDSFVEAVYLKHQFDYPLNYKLIEGDCEIVDGVYAITTSGHTPGHQSLIVDLPKSGTIILVGDAIYTNASIDDDIPPGNSWNMSATIDSINRIRTIHKREKAKLFITHEANFFENFRPAPHFYE